MDFFLTVPFAAFGCLLPAFLFTLFFRLVLMFLSYEAAFSISFTLLYLKLFLVPFPPITNFALRFASLLPLFSTRMDGSRTYRGFPSFPFLFLSFAAASARRRAAQEAARGG